MYPKELAKTLAENIAKAVRPYLERYKTITTEVGGTSREGLAALDGLTKGIIEASNNVVMDVVRTYGLPKVFIYAVPVINVETETYILTYNLFTEGGWQLANITITIPLRDPNSSSIVVTAFGRWKVYLYSIYPFTDERQQDELSLEEYTRAVKRAAKDMKVLGAGGSKEAYDLMRKRRKRRQ
ncbi:MAG: hypothetical protein ACK4SY_07130 [Pyrobaculum sp.]